MATLSARLERAGLTLPPPPAPLAHYVPAITASSGRLVFVSGQVPIIDGNPMATGRVPDEVSIEEARGCARRCVLNALAALAAEIGDIERLRRVIKLDGFVASPPGFTDHPKVIDGASELLVELLADEGKHARAAVGVTGLPLGVPVEIAFTFLVD